MRRPIALVAVALLLPGALLFASSDDAAWRADIDALRREIPGRHVNAFTRISRQEFEASLDRLHSEVPSLADHEIVIGMLRALAAIGDAHTSLYASWTQFPVTVRWFHDGFYVIRSTEPHQDLLGSELVAIDARPASDILAALAQVIPHENEWWLRELAARQITSPEVLDALGVIPTLERASFRVRRSDGTVVERTLEALPRGQTPSVEMPDPGRRPLYLRNVATNYWYEYLPASGTLYVQYNRCAEMPSKSATSFGEELGAFARSHRVSRLVLDLRHNTGGNSALIRPLLTDLYTSAPHLDDPARFFVIIGPLTFSSALMNAIEIDRSTQATLVGLPTGGKPNHFGNVGTFRLPRSGLTVQYSTRWYVLIPEGDPESLMPEIEVTATAADYFAGRDAVLLRLVPEFPRRRAVAR